HVLGRLAHFGVQRMRYELRALMATNLTFVITSFLSLVGYALGLAIGAYLYMRGEATIGTAFLIVFYIGMLAEPLEGIRVQLEDLQRAGAALGRVSELLALQPLVRETDHPAPLPAGPLSVAFTDVSFAYRDDESDTRVVLHELNFALEPGQVLGLLGRTGSGKSTLTRLLFRLYDPSSGRIRLGGHLLADLALDNVRARIGMVTQEVQIFQASVRDNLTLFNDRIDDQRIFTALDELGLRAWVESLPAGLATNLGAGGMGLSAGEAQLLAFARVLLRDPGLVILDEASSRLDPATERLLEQAVDRLLAGRTAIIIAHRLQTVQRADQIMILDQGRIAEYGARRMLLADPQSQFSNLLRVGMQEVLA
ncbi:MAG TPA: ABC transporter ATP-binding protein, partial [Roseiflexaceae bacterium]|nr:ABC transporter ATP-binding protein [Roseiflexaceae bacterium]